MNASVKKVGRGRGKRERGERGEGEGKRRKGEKGDGKLLVRGVGGGGRWEV